MSDLKNLSLDEKKALVTKINTEVVSVASEEQRTGSKINLPDAERLVANASISLLQCKKEIRNMMMNMSKREIIRGVSAFLDLPQNELPVMLKSDKEKLLFVTGQRAIMDRYVVITHHINKEIMLQRQKNQETANKEVPSV